MLVIPAIDLREGRVVRLLRGDFTKETSYSGNPVDIAKNWESQGARLIHVVDLDGALYGEPKNLDSIEKIKKALSAPVQVGGGLRTEELVAKVLSLGVDRAIIGTRAYTDNEFLKRVIKLHKEKISVSIDAVGEFVASRGWTELTDIKAVELAKRLEAAGVKTIIYTNILQDGTLQSPQLESVRKILDTVKIDVIIAGGISSLRDIRDLKALNKPNLYGVITGKALYEGKFELKEAIKIAGDS